MILKDKNNYNYYYKKRNIITQWENAPGKEVILNFIKSLLKKGLIKKNATILDVGCGTGYFLRRLRDECSRGFSLIGIDISEEAIKNGKNFKDDIVLNIGDGSQTGFRSKSFDLIISYGSYEHFKNPRKAIREAARLLKNNMFIACMQPTLGVQRPDINGEGWYKETDKAGQMQWNLYRKTWEMFFYKAGFFLFFDTLALIHGAKKPGNFYFGILRII